MWLRPTGGFVEARQAKMGRLATISSSDSSPESGQSNSNSLKQPIDSDY